MGRGRKLDPVLIAGIAALAVGMLLLFSSGFSLFGSLNASRSSFTEVSGDEYVSSNITLTDETVLFVLNVTGNYNLVPASDISEINSSNIADYSVKHVPGNEIDVGGVNYSAGQNSSLYGKLSGSYAIVAFSQSYPNITYFIGGSASTVFLGAGGIMGAGMLFFGVPVTVIGAIREARARRRSKDLEDLMNL